MGEKLYYLLEVFIFLGLGIYFIIKPDPLLKFFKKAIVVRLLGVVAILNAIINAVKLFN